MKSVNAMMDFLCLWKQEAVPTTSLKFPTNHNHSNHSSPSHHGISKLKCSLRAVVSHGIWPCPRQDGPDGQPGQEEVGWALSPAVVELFKGFVF